MKQLLILFCFYCSFAFAQTKAIPTTINGGINQFGNNNTQNIYQDKRLTQQDTGQLNGVIFKLKKDSNFYAVKYFDINLASTNNAAAMKVDLIKYFTERGLIYIGNEGIRVYGRLIKGINISLSKKDSSLKFVIGVL